MFQSVFSKLAATGVVIALAASAGVAQARDVSWSVGIGVPGVVVGASNGYGYSGYGGYSGYQAPAPVYYAPPPPVYYQAPRPVYYAPPVVYSPAPVYYGGSYYRDNRYYDGGYRRHGHGHDRDDQDDRDDRRDHGWRR